MWRRQKYLAVALAGIVVSLANGAPVLRINGLDATVPVKVEGKDKLIISVVGAGDVNEQSYSVICEDRGRVEPLSGPNEVDAGGATAYRFVFDDDWELGTVLLVADQNMVIDGIAITAGTEIYKLHLCYSLQAETTTVIGIDFEALRWVTPEPEQQEAPASEDSIPEGEAQLPLVGESPVLPLAAGSGYDPTMDLNADGKIDFKDFAVLAAGWQTTYDIYDLDTMCDAFGSTDTCADTNVPDANNFDNWEAVVFTGIGGCGEYDCWIEPDYSDPCWDDCGGRVYVGCVETQEFDYTCSYNFWFDGWRVGLCPYKCGANYFWILKNVSGRRIIGTRHISRDRPEYYPEYCDEQTIGKYNWQVVFTNVVTRQRDGLCREGSQFSPEINYGETGPCKYVWW